MTFEKWWEDNIHVATGFDSLDPTGHSPMQQYGYGRYANVFNLTLKHLTPTELRALFEDCWHDGYRQGREMDTRFIEDY